MTLEAIRRQVVALFFKPPTLLIESIALAPKT
jgi:hypothetical protein